MGYFKVTTVHQLADTLMRQACENPERTVGDMLQNGNSVQSSRCVDDAGMRTPGLRSQGHEPREGS